MTQDLYYVESGYLTPDSGYYIYTADAEAAVSSNATMTVAVGVIKSASSTIASTATVTAVISHIHGADLVALSNAAITTEINVIRTTNIALTSVFSATTDVSRIRHISADDFASATVLVGDNLRVRYSEAAVSAASSLTADIELVPGGTVVEASGSWSSTATVECAAKAKKNIIDCDVTVVADLAASGDRIRFSSALLEVDSNQFTNAVFTAFGAAAASSSFSQTANNSRVRDVSIAESSAFTPTLSVDVFKNSVAVLDASASMSISAVKQTATSAALSSVASQTALAGKLLGASVSLTSRSELFVSRKAYGPRPHDLVSGNISAPTYYNTSISKFGSASFIGVGSTSLKESLYITQSEDYVMEAWIYPTTANQTVSPLLGVTVANLGPYIDLSSGALRFRAYLANPSDPDASVLTTYFTDSVDLPLNQWTHVLLVKSGGTNGYLSLYKDGTRIYTRGTGTAPVFDQVYGYTNLTNMNFGVRASSTVLVDEAMFVKDSSYGYDATQTSITVPTTVRLNDNTITGLYHLNSNALDDTTLVQTAAAAISSASTVTATLTGPQRATASISASAALSASAAKTLGGSADISSAASVSATALRIQSSEVSASSQATVTANLAVTRSAAASQSAAFTQSVAANRTRNLSIATDAIFSELAAVVKIGQGLITLDSTASLSANINVVAGAAAAVSATATVSATASAIRGFTWYSQDIDNFIICDVLRIQSSAVSLSSSCDLAAVIGELFNVSANLTAVSTLEATTSGLIDISADLAGNATLSANNTRLKFGLADLSLAADLTASSDIVKVAQATLSASASLSTSPTVVRSGQATVAAFVAELAAAVKIGQGLVAMDSAASVSATATTVSSASAQLASQATVVGQALRIKSTTANLASVAAITAVIGSIKPAASALSSQASVSASISKGQSAAASLSTSATLNATALRIKTFTSQLNSEATVTARITVAIVFVSANLTAVSTLTVTTNAEFSINLTAFSNCQLTAIVDAIHIDPELTWMIFADDRDYSIQADTRTYSIVDEDRDYMIVQENREYAVTRELLTTELQGV